MAGPRMRSRWLKRLVLALLALVVGVIVVAGALLVIPIGIDRPAPAAAAPMSREAALATIQTLQADEAADPVVRDDCRTRLHDGGAGAPVVVLFHGYTNCPKQWDAFAAELADRGYTVYVPRAPFHGEDPDRRRPLGLLNATDIARYANDSMDVASGLGDDVTVLGLSGGGLVASYIAQYRPDADLVIPVAAFLGLPSVPMPLTPLLVNGLSLLPTIDSREAPPDEAVRGPYPHGASDTSAQGATAYMRVADTVLRSATDTPPAAGRVMLVANDNDDIVNNGMIDTLIARWAALAGDRVGSRHLPASLGLLHDLVTPDREGAHPEIAYPILLELMGAP